MKKVIEVGSVLAVIILLLASGCEKISDPVVVSEFQVNRNVTMSASTQEPLNKRTFYRYETIYLTFENLYPGEQVDIQIIRERDLKILKRLLVFTDEYGAIRDVPIWYYIGHEGPCHFENLADKYVVHLIQPGVNRLWRIYSIPFEIVKSFPNSPQIRVIDAAGCFLAGSVQPGDPLIIEGSVLPKNQNVQLLVVNERPSYMVGEVLTDMSDNGIEAVFIGESRALAPTVIWNSITPGAYDVIVDTAPFGVYNTGDIVNDMMLTGVIVQNIPNNGHIIQDIACDRFGNYKNYFDSLETVYAKVNAFTQPRLLSEFVSVFLTPHRQQWLEGDSLVSLCTVGTFEMPLDCLWNGTAGSLPIIACHGRSDRDDPTPIRLWPGIYDVVIDVDRNYVYNPGIDILDGGDQPGFIVPGSPPPVRFGANADLDFLGIEEDDPNLQGVFRDEIHTSVWGVVVDSLGNFIEKLPIRYDIVWGPGSVDRDSSFTNLYGASIAVFRGGEWGKGTLVQLSVIVDGKLYIKYVLIFRKIPYSHNQGIIIGE